MVYQGEKPGVWQAHWAAPPVGWRGPGAGVELAEEGQA